MPEYFHFALKPDAAPISEPDRQSALDHLAHAAGEGRLNAEDFDVRSNQVLEATSYGQLKPLFNDIPPAPNHSPKLYSHQDIERARKSSAKPRLGIALTTTALAGGGAVAAMAMSGQWNLVDIVMSGDPTALSLGALSLALILVIPVTWFLLYVSKVGPESWHQPSPRQLEKQRLKEIEATSAQRNAELKEAESQIWARNRAQAGELTRESLDLAKRKLGKRTGSQ